MKPIMLLSVQVQTLREPPPSVKAELSAAQAPERAAVGRRTCFARGGTDAASDNDQRAGVGAHDSPWRGVWWKPHNKPGSAASFQVPVASPGKARAAFGAWPGR
jgi:hypothetical protein